MQHATIRGHYPKHGRRIEQILMSVSSETHYPFPLDVKDVYELE